MTQLLTQAVVSRPDLCLDSGMIALQSHSLQSPAANCSPSLARLAEKSFWIAEDEDFKSCASLFPSLMSCADLRMRFQRDEKSCLAALNPLTRVATAKANDKGSSITSCSSKLAVGTRPCRPWIYKNWRWNCCSVVHSGKSEAQQRWVRRPLIKDFLSCG